MSDEKRSVWSTGQLMEVAMVELERMKDEHGFVRLDVEPGMLLSVIGMLQLAMRHPDVKQRPSYGAVAKFIEDIRGNLKEYPALSELLRRGAIEKYDEEK